METTKGAIFSTGRQHRFILFRIWDDTKPKMMFIGLNPSTANENENDNTINKVIKIAQHNGFGGCYMANLFSYVSTDPTQLKTSEIVHFNDDLITDYAKGCEKIVFAWGGFKVARERAEVFKKMFTAAYCIKKNKDGSPAHPLYQLDKSTLIKF